MGFFNTPWALALLIIVVIAAIVGICIWLIRKGYIKQVKAGLLYLVYLAEEEYGGGTGALKFAAVSEQIYSVMPAWLKPFISTELIRILINNAVDELKEYLSDNEAARVLLINNCIAATSEATKLESMVKQE